MSKLHLFGLILLMAVTLSVSASEKSESPALGVYHEVLIDQVDADQLEEKTKVIATVIRDGAPIEIESGEAVFADDVVITPAGGAVTVAYIQGQTVTLQESTRLTVTGGSIDGTGFTLNSGHAFLFASGRETSSLSFAMGDSASPVARATTRASNTVKLDIIVTKNAAGAFVTNVAATGGSVTLVPVAGKPSVNVVAGTTAVMTINTTTNPATGAVTTSTITKDQIKALKAVNFSETLVAQGKAGFGFKSTIKNGDGSISKGSVATNLAGGVVKDSWKTANKADKSSVAWSQDTTKGTIKVASKFGGNSFAASFVGNNATKAALKGSNKQSYKGTATYNPATGLITFTTTTPGKDGSTAVYTYDPRDPAKAVETIIVTTGGVAGTPITHSLVTGPPPASVPSGALIEQNMPPKSN